MNCKYKIMTEAGYGAHGRPTYNVVKTFKHEQNAVNFYNDPKNFRAHRGNLVLERVDSNGARFSYNDGSGEWEPVWEEI